MIAGSALTMQASEILIPGSIIYIDHLIAVIKISMGGSCAIPLGVLKPKAINIIAWSFVGFSGQTVTDPSCVLILGCQDEGAFFDISSVSVCTHIGDRCVDLTSKSTPLTRDETSVVAKAVISALGPASLAYFDALIPILGVGLDTILADRAACDLSVTRDDAADVWIARNIDFVPDCMIVRSPAGFTWGPITSVRFHAPHRAVMTLTTGAPLNTPSVNGAILSGHGQYTAAHVIGAV